MLQSGLYVIAPEMWKPDQSTSGFKIGLYDGLYKMMLSIYHSELSYCGHVWLMTDDICHQDMKQDKIYLSNTIEEDSLERPVSEHCLCLDTARSEHCFDTIPHHR